MTNQIINAKKFSTILDEICAKFARDNAPDLKKGNAGIVGIHTRGVVLAKRMAGVLKKKHKFTVDVGSLDITLYRDDVGEIGNQPLEGNRHSFSDRRQNHTFGGRCLYTGRTIRAALDALLELGRPKMVRLAVVIDRDGRELPMQADYMGAKMFVTENGKVQIKVKEVDGEDAVCVVPPRKNK